MQEKIRLIIIMGLVVMLAVSLFIGQQTYSAKKAIELERNGLRNENENLAGKLEEITKERKQLQERVFALNNDLDKLLEEKQDIQKQYELIVKERGALIERLKALQRNNEQLRTDLNNLSLEKKRLGQNLEDNLASLKNENAQLKEQLKQQLDNLNSLKEQIDAIRSGGQQAEAEAEVEAEAETETPQAEEESIELPPIVVRPQTQAQVRTPALPEKSTPVKSNGRVLEINKEDKFVIIDLGQDAGIKIGDTLKVYKQGKAIGTIEVVQVRQTISACDIKEEIIAIEAGDTVSAS